MRKINCKKFVVRVGILIALIAVLPVTTNSQIRSGIGYLKMHPGVRGIGMAGTLTGAVDFTHSLYANPGATGFLREWQWAATYTNWISDIYNASFLYGRRTRMPWSQQTKIALGLNYLGIPKFNSSTNADLSASGNNLLATASIGQPLTFLTNNISFGTNLKFFKSELAQYAANSVIYDFGFLYRSSQIDIQQLWRVIPRPNFFNSAILSAGVSMINMGEPVKYKRSDYTSLGTPLPTTFRAGVALNLGAHHGFRLNAATDYRQVKDQDGFLTVGGELFWQQIVSLRMGYSFEDNLLGNFSFGGSLQLDERLLKSLVPGGNSAFRLDLAMNQNNSFFTTPYHGSISQIPVGPESFYLTSPEVGAQIHADTLVLAWESTKDPDLFDDFSFWLLVDQDSTKFSKLLEIAQKEPENLISHLANETFLKSEQLEQTHYLMGQLKGGDYFWTVFAYDLNKHIRFADLRNGRLGEFRVTIPQPEVIAADFDHNRWITPDDYQGKLKFTIKNNGDRTATNYVLSILDFEDIQLATSETGALDTRFTEKLIAEKIIPELAPGESIAVELDWRTDIPGKHQISTQIYKPDRSRVVHDFSTNFFTVPKGTLATADTVTVLKLVNITYELPYIGKLFFARGQADIDPKYYQNWIMTPPLAKFAERLKQSPELKVTLKATVDPNSGETEVQLANDRAKAVSNLLRELGVSSEQINILPGEVHPLRKLPHDTTDARWLLQERRCVEVISDHSIEEELFKPCQTNYDQKRHLPITFEVNLASVIPVKFSQLEFKAGKMNARLDLTKKFSGHKLVQAVEWDLPSSGYDTTDTDSTSNWLHQELKYQLVLTDSLNREFKTYAQKTYLNSQIFRRERRYYILAQFAQAKPYYDFYWANLLDRIPFLLSDPDKRMRFIGHGCAIGSDKINESLSQKRAQQFHQKFLTDVKKRYPNLYTKIKKRLDPVKGLGENEPLEFKSDIGNIILLGDNDLAIGRQLNRRVMVLFYTNGSK